MKTQKIKPFQIHKSVAGGAILAALLLSAAHLHAVTVSLTFGFQKNNLTTNTVAYGSGAGYSGVVDGSISDGSVAGALTTGLTSTIGNQFRSPNGQNGQQHVGLFSYDLTELNDFITANTGPNISVAIASVSMTVIAASAVSGSVQTVSLFGTDPFTSPGCTWSNYTTGIQWTVPFQNIASNLFLYGYTGGGSALTAGLAGSSPSTGVGAGNPMTWTSSANFINAVTNALAQADKKLYLTARVNFFNNGDNRLSVIYSPTNTVALRPQLQITVNVTTTAASATWTGASGTSWTTAANWLANAVPATDAPIIFDNNSIANLNTVLNQDFTITSISVTNPSGAVSIGGVNTLTNGAGGIDMSAATQNLTISAPVVLGASQTWNVGSGRTLGVNGAVSGSAPLTIAGAGKVSLGAANVLPNGASATNIAVNGTLDLNGFSQSVNALTGNGIVDNSGGGTAILAVGNNNASGTFSGTLQNTSGTLALDKVGSGTLTLTGTSTFSGGTTNNGPGILNSGNAAGTNHCFGTGPVVANAGTLYMTVNSWTFTNALTLNGGTLRQGGGNSRLLTWSGPVSVPASSSLLSDGGTAGIAIYGNVSLTSGATLGSAAGGTYHTIYGSIGGNGNLTVSSGYLVLDGVNNYSGSTLLSAGVLRLEANGTLPTGSALTINGSGNFNVRTTNGWAYNGTITGDGTGSIYLNTGTTATLAGSISGVAAINVNSTNTDTTISGGISGANTVTVQSGGGILRLTGINSYSGATTVQTNAVLFVNGDNSGATGIVQVNEGGTLAGGGSVGGAVTVIGNVSPGTAGSAGVGSVGTLTLASTLDVSGLAVGSGKLNFDLGTTNASDKIVVGSTLTLGAGVIGFTNFVFANVGGLQNGTYKLITSGTTITDTLDGANLTGSVGAGTGTLQVSGGGTDIELVVSGIGGGGPSPTLLTNSVSGGGTTLDLSWPAGQGWRLLQQTNALSKGLSTNWVDVTPGSASSTNIPLDKTKPATFYRLVYP